MIRSAALLGLRIDSGSVRCFARRVEARIRNRGGASRYIATINVDFVANTLRGDAPLQRRQALIQALRQADLATADGMPIVWLLRLCGFRLPGRVTGADLFAEWAQRSARKGRRVFLIGGDAATYARALDRVDREFPRIVFAGALHPSVNDEGYLCDPATGRKASLAYTARFFEAVRNAQPDLLCLCLGNPKQELFFKNYGVWITAPVTIGVGGVMNFLAGAVRRAPAWIGALGMEWLFRLSQEPRRLFGRYARDAILLGRYALPLALYAVARRLSDSLRSAEGKRSASEVEVFGAYLARMRDGRPTPPAETEVRLARDSRLGRRLHRVDDIVTL